jgi:hypothetical protein
MQPTAPRAEDLDGVLGRFHAWSSTRKDAHRRKDFVDGVRELSYEEALESTRRRWQLHNPSPSASPRKDAQPATDAAFEDQHIAPDKATLSTLAKPLASTSAAAQEATPGSFGSVLSGTLSPDISSGPLALVWPSAEKSERQVSMSLRVAASEQALIKARAAEAGLSVSAYLRQCALEVENLRAQVHHRLALMGQEQNPIRSLSSGSPATSGFLARLRQRVFGAPARLTLRA